MKTLANRYTMSRYISANKAGFVLPCLAIVLPDTVLRTDKGSACAATRANAMRLLTLPLLACPLHLELLKMTAFAHRCNRWKQARPVGFCCTAHRLACWGESILFHPMF